MPTKSKKNTPAEKFIRVGFYDDEEKIRQLKSKLALRGENISSWGRRKVQEELDED